MEDHTTSECRQTVGVKHKLETKQEIGQHEDSCKAGGEIIHDSRRRVL